MADCTSHSTFTTSPDMSNLVDFVLAMRKRDRRFRRICRQLVLMNNNIRAARRRYERSPRVTSSAEPEDDIGCYRGGIGRGFRYAQRMRLMTLEGVRDVFTAYAHKEADALEEMEEELRDEHSIEWSDVANSDEEE